MTYKLMFLMFTGLWTGASHAVIGGRMSTVFPEVVKLHSGRVGERICSGTIIGPRVVISAAHCADSESPYFSLNGKRYRVRFVKSVKSGKGHDVALAITERDIQGARIARVVESGVKHGSKVFLAGFGCTRAGGRPGKLHVGTSRVIGMDADHLLSGEQKGGVLCDGDSGGPAFLQAGRKFILAAVNSLSDIASININVRLDSAQSRQFLADAARTNDVAICGVSGC